jgi:hypothetical protein
MIMIINTAATTVLRPLRYLLDFSSSLAFHPDRLGVIGSPVGLNPDLYYAVGSHDLPGIPDLGIVDVDVGNPNSYVPGVP